LRPSERVRLVQSIAIELQSRWTFIEIDHYFDACQVSHRAHPHGNYGSKRVYAQSVLSNVPDSQCQAIAADLGIVQHGATVVPVEPPQNWQNTKRFRLFISHISKDKLIATRLKDALATYEIAGFVAHEDIHPTLAWQDEIERGLRTMDAMVAVHTKGFGGSFWTQQEIGFALGRGVKVISFKYGEDPTGFIGKHQALSRLDRSAEEIAAEINRLLADDPRTEGRLKAAKPTKSFTDLDVEEDVPF
jgi:TIR domain